ncbi:Lsr2 family protein [Nonomuraea endophytica]|uniref:Lsr2 family protein n=1 Tax=Nonomuraea endophytica TaxID=714136 RepID=UPI0037CA9388
MAKHIVETITDDINGVAGAQTYRFGWGNDTFEIDLADANYAKLEKALAPFINAARLVRAPAAGRGRAGRRVVLGESRKMTREQSAEIRQWAKEQGLPVSERGRIASTVIEKYEAAR